MPVHREKRCPRPNPSTCALALLLATRTLIAHARVFKS
jgi:hypothetical protein